MQQRIGLATRPDRHDQRIGDELRRHRIESVTMRVDGVDGPEAEMVAKVADLAKWATNDNAALRGGGLRSMLVVAGVGFEPTTFRL